jgi:uncharacterized protein (DUF1330 family)
MAKGYWVVCYKSISDPTALAEYAKLAEKAIPAAGGRFVVRGVAAKAYELGLSQRTVVIEFESVEQAKAAYESPAYQAAARMIDGKVERDFRIVEGVA